jgi:hypothetical protein
VIGTAGAAALRGPSRRIVAIRPAGHLYFDDYVALSRLLYFIYLQTPFTQRRRHPGEFHARDYCSGFSNLAKP